MIERNCLNCVWFTEENRHCNYFFRQIYQNDVCLEAERCPKYCKRISIPKTEFIPLDLIEDYRNIVEKIKEYIISELKKRYDDVKFEDEDKDLHLLCFSIKNILFDLLLLNNFINISYYDDFRCGDDKLETFEDLFKYIDDIINEEE